MSLARVWKRQLLAASSAALIVPCAMLAALVALALGGGFGQVGVLGQIFSGPPAIGAGAPSATGPTAATSHALAAIPASAGPDAVRRPPRRGTRTGGPGTSGVSSRTGGAGAAPIVTGSPIRSAPRPGPAAPSAPGSGSPAPTSASPTPGSPSPQPAPPPKPTVVDQVVTTVTPVTQQLPGPVGPAVTQAVQAAGSAADGLLPPVPGPSGNLP